MQQKMQEGIRQAGWPIWQKRQKCLALIVIKLAAQFFVVDTTVEWDVLDPMALRSPKEWRVPDPPEEFRAQSNTPDTMTLWWEPPSSANEVMVRGYTLSYGIGSSLQKIVIEGAGTNSFTVTSLKPNTTYAFALTAYNEADGEDSQRVLLSATTRALSSQNNELLTLTSFNAKFVPSTNEILVTWTDPNLNVSANAASSALSNGNGVDLTSRQIFYLIKYMWLDLTNKAGDKWQKSMPQTFSVDKPEALITLASGRRALEVRASAVYIIDGIEQRSVWSVPLFIDIYAMQDDNGGSALEVTRVNGKANAPRRAELCDFESASLCDFINDPNSTLKWRRIVTPPRHIAHGRYSMVVSYPQVDSAKEALKQPEFARLLSPVYDLKRNDHLCISFFYEIGPFSYGAVFKISVLHEADDWADSVLLMRKSLNMEQAKEFVAVNDRTRRQIQQKSSLFHYDLVGDWRKVSLETRAKPRRGFQVIFEVIKETRDAAFRLAIDDLKVAARRCPTPDRQPHGIIDGKAIKLLY